VEEPHTKTNWPTDRNINSTHYIVKKAEENKFDTEGSENLCSASDSSLRSIKRKLAIPVEYFLLEQGNKRGIPWMPVGVAIANV
jgi:hypothetical protein